MFYSYPIDKKECEVFSAMETFTSVYVRSLMQTFSSGKISKPRVGILKIVNRFIPEIKNSASNLLPSEGTFVFYACEKFSTGFFSKPQIRTFIWNPISEVVFAVPPQSVLFEKPIKGASQKIFICSAGSEHQISKYNRCGKEHICTFKKMELFREFDIYEKEMCASKDILIQYFNWSNPDPWVIPDFQIKDECNPMYYLRHNMEKDEVPGWSVRISYPDRPAMFGLDISE